MAQPGSAASLVVDLLAREPHGSIADQCYRARIYASLLAVLYIGAVATAIAYAIWGDLLARYPAAVVAPFALLAPCAGVLASALVFGERFNSTRYAGMALIVMGLAFIVLPTASAVSERERARMVRKS